MNRPPDPGTPDPGLPDPGPGHNGGPPLEPDVPDDPGGSWRLFCWRKAHRSAWKTPPREIALRRLERAEALGMTYREYTLEILERGRFP
ncbi:MAG: hypothetical protein QOF70_2636 [Acetobacteraceae bacterium]|nr:hypothetical protein [Acetobacteraceae bacterium]